MARTLVLGLPVLFCQWHVAAFWASLPRQQINNCGEGFFMVPLSNEEIFARAQQTKEEQDIPPPPKLFEDDMLDDMQSALLLLEKRVQEGPLTLLEVDQLTSQLDKIRYDMKQNKHKKPPRPSTTSAHSTSIGTDQSPKKSAVAPLVIDMDTPADEGAAYDGRGGMGQAADTTNTYVIPGMEQMTADEYQSALEQTIIERQRQRRYGGGPTGNRSSWNYLNSLTGESGILKKKQN